MAGMHCHAQWCCAGWGQISGPVNGANPLKGSEVFFFICLLQGFQLSIDGSLPGAAVNGFT